MKFGKLNDISDVDFLLPEEDESNLKVLDPSNNYCHFYIGATAWTTKEWKGKIYPAKTASANFLREYGRHFNSIELNSTFYNLPGIETIKRWYDQVPEDFKFCPKVWKLISHRKNLGLTDHNLTRYIDHIIHFQQKLGPVFMQLPPYFSYSSIDILKEFVRHWPDELTLSLELRHESFFLPSHFEAILKLCRKQKIILLITDVAGRRDIMHSSLSHDTAMIRWVGNGLHPTDYKRIDAWTDRFQSWSEKGIKEIYFLTHQPDNILTPEISHYLASKLKARTHIISRGPKLNDSNNQLSLL